MKHLYLIDILQSALIALYMGKTGLLQHSSAESTSNWAAVHVNGHSLQLELGRSFLNVEVGSETE